MSGSALDSVSPELRPVCHWSVAVIVIVGQRSGPVTQHAAHTLTPGHRISAADCEVVHIQSRSRRLLGPSSG